MLKELEQLNLFKNYTIVIKPSIIKYLLKQVKPEFKKKFKKIIESNEDFIQWVYENNEPTDFTYIYIKEEQSIENIEICFKIKFNKHCIFKKE